MGSTFLRNTLVVFLLFQCYFSFAREAKTATIEAIFNPVVSDNRFEISDCISVISGNVILDDNGQGTDSCAGCTLEVSSFQVAGFPDVFAPNTPIQLFDVGTITINSDGVYNIEINDAVGTNFPIITYTVVSDSGDTAAAELEITIAQTPAHDQITIPANACGSFELPQLTVGAYYNDIDGTSPRANPIVGPGVTSIYVLVENPKFPGCFKGSVFPITVFRDPDPDVVDNTCDTDGIGYTATLNLGTIVILSVSEGQFTDNVVTVPSNNPIEVEVRRVISGFPCSNTITINPPATCNNCNSPVATVMDVRCSNDLSTYSVVLAVTVGNIESVNFGEIQGSTIVNIPINEEIEITLENNNCREIINNIPIPNCTCPQVPPPTSTGDKEFCERAEIEPLEVIPPQGDYTIFWYQNEQDEDPIQAGNTFAPQKEELPIGRTTFWVETEDNTSLCSSDRIPISYEIYEFPELAEITNVQQCSSYVLPPLPQGNFYTTQADGNGDLLSSGQEIETSQEVYVNVASANNFCLASRPFQVEILEIPELPPFESYSFCNENEILDPIVLGMDLGDEFVYDWTPDNDTDGDGIEEPMLITDKSGNYQLEVFRILDDGSLCGDGTIYESEISIGAELPESISTEFTQESNRYLSGNQVSINVETNNTTGQSTAYEYSLDNPDGPYQDDNVFQNVPPGIHIGYVRSKGGCNALVQGDPFLVVNYPTYISPNADGTADSWNVLGLDELKFRGQLEVYIFDRYGRFIKQIQPSEQGWDGWMENTIAPNDDYWFEVKYTGPFLENTISVDFKGHFSLKR